MSNYLVKVTPAATEGGAPTATVESRTFFQAVGDSLTSMMKSDEASVGYAKTVVGVGLAYGSAVLAKARQTGQFDWNPL